MTVSPDDARHLTVTTLDELWNGGSADRAADQRANQRAVFRLDPANGLITL